LQDPIIEFVIRKKHLEWQKKLQDGIDPTIVKELGFVEASIYGGITK
jgi:hypothetical protein